MEKEIKVEPSEDLAYWVGAVQSDGCLTKYTVKRDKYRDKREIRIELSFHISSKSLPMLEKFKDVSEKIFDRHAQIWKVSGREEYRFHITVKRLLPLFKLLDITLSSPFFTPPKWAFQEFRFFGAYLAGLIDGDGDIAVKRPKYPQCAITISSGSFQDILSKSITKILGCFVHQAKDFRISIMKDTGQIIRGTRHRLAFYVSSKTSRFILDFVTPHLQLEYKKKKLEEFIFRRYPSVIEN